MPGIRDKAATLIILVAAVLLTQVPLFPWFVFPGLGNWLYLCFLFTFGLMASLPFILMKMAPKAAGFGKQWLPVGWLQWFGVLVLILLMFVAGSFAGALTRCFILLPHRPYYQPTITSFSRLNIVVNGLLFILVTPVAEEIFWRGYVLDQLRKLMHWALALPIHALVFALVHFIFSVTLLLPMGAFFYAIVLGAWRIKFKSLLPLIVAHVTINAVATAPILHRDYEILRSLETSQATGEIPANLLTEFTSNPNCQRIAALTRQPPADALPVLVDFLRDGDDAVGACAAWAIIQYRREDVRPYLKRALASTEKKIIDGALLILAIRPDPTLREEVRRVVWSTHGLKLQIAAIVTLQSIGDTDGLRKIAEGHPNKKTRNVAKRCLRP
jgi:membrane protease YdiL (CAAX protease family)